MASSEVLLDSNSEKLQDSLSLFTQNSYPTESYYLFPFMRELISAPVENKVYGSSVSTVNNSDARDTWRIISGKWQPTADGVQAGDTSYSLHNIVVRPVTFNSSDLSIDTSFTINSLAPNTASYVSIVYSWIDQKNFKIAGIGLWNSDTVPGLRGAYADFGSVRNGTLVWDPAWPGVKIESNSFPREPINMRLSLRDSSEELFVNGAQVLQRESSDSTGSGYVGLSYGRVQDIVFHQFNSQ
jgi:hypothetical protein